VLAEWLARRTGHTALTLPALTLPALDLADSYAPLADDPYYGAFSMLARARVLTHYGESEVAASLIDSAIDTAGDQDTEPSMVLAGYSHLAGAINEARQLNYSGAMDHMGAAREFAARTGETDLYLTAFGPLNVEIHRPAVELEAGDPYKAAIDGATLEYGIGAPPTRVAHHWHDNARAWLMTEKPDKALMALNKARHAAPQQTRLHPSVRETLFGIASAERRRTDSLGNFARWVGVTL